MISTNAYVQQYFNQNENETATIILLLFILCISVIVVVVVIASFVALFRMFHTLIESALLCAHLNRKKREDKW